MSYASTMQFLQTGMASGPGTEDPRYLAGARRPIRRTSGPQTPRCACIQFTYINGIFVCTKNTCTEGEHDLTDRPRGYGGARSHADAIRLNLTSRPIPGSVPRLWSGKCKEGWESCGTRCCPSGVGTTDPRWVDPHRPHWP